jgi:hypothetical protein
MFNHYTTPPITRHNIAQLLPFVKSSARLCLLNSSRLGFSGAESWVEWK